MQSPIIIIGAGMAGYTLARELRKLNSDIAITLISRDSADSYAKPTLSNAFAQNKSAQSIANATAESMANSLNITVMNFYQVSDVDVAQKTITVHPVLATDKQQILPYSKLVLATGANPRTLPHCAIDNEQIFAVNHLDDYKKFQQTISDLLEQAHANNPIKVAIIGAGLIGCEFANDLVSQIADKNLQITVFDSANLPLANQLPAQAGTALQQALEQAGVTFNLGIDIEAIKTESADASKTDTNKPNTITITVKDSAGNLSVISADVVLIAIGLVANTELAENIGLRVAHLSDTVQQQTHLPRTAKQGILVDKFLQTSQADIYALGDCANVAGSFMPYVMPLMNQAKALAQTLANATTAETDPSPTAVSYPAMPVAIKTPCLPLVVLPVSAHYSDDMIVWQTTPTDDGMILSAVSKMQTDKLLGFVLVGKEAGKQRLTLVKQVDNWL